MRPLLICLALAACGMQRTGGDESIPTVNAVYVQDDVQTVAYASRTDGGECPVQDAVDRFRRGDEFNPLENCDD